MKDLSLHILDIVENSIRAGATIIKITINENIKQNIFLLKIKDNGKGFPTKEIRKFPLQGKLGIIGIKERAKLLNGIVNIKSEINKYTSLSVEFEYGNTPTMSQNTSRYQTLNTPISKSS